MTGLARRIERLEEGEADFAVGLAERLAAARQRWETDPESMDRNSQEHMASLAARGAAGERLTRLELRLLAAHRRLEGMAA